MDSGDLNSFIVSRHLRINGLRFILEIGQEHCVIRTG